MQRNFYRPDFYNLWFSSDRYNINKIYIVLMSHYKLLPTKFRLELDEIIKFCHYKFDNKINEKFFNKRIHIGKISEILIDIFNELCINDLKFECW